MTCRCSTFMLECDKPHRTCIHPLHLTAWVEHLASVFMPLEIVNAQMVDGEETMWRDTEQILL